jgi:opacity protein-like surface antigen
MKYILLLSLFVSFSTFAQNSMRRCSLLPVTDSVGGAIGYKVFEEIEKDLKRSNWCTYVSNSSMIGVFSRYRENLPQYLKTKEVLQTVAQKLKVGSVILVQLKNELNGLEVELSVYGDNGVDLYFSEKTLLRSDDVPVIAQTAQNWLDMYAKMIPYDAKVTGVLGDQVTLDVGKGHYVKSGQTFIIKRETHAKKHPLLKKIVDWEAEKLAEGKVFNVSDNQALGMVKVYKSDKKIKAGDWVRLEEYKEEDIPESSLEDPKSEAPGTLGILSVAILGSSSSVDTTTPTGSNRMSGNLIGIDLRAEGWITRQYFAALEIERTMGSLKKSSGNPDKDDIGANNGMFKITGGYKYLPIGFFYGPQIDLYAGFGSHSFDLDVSEKDGFGSNTISGILLGASANIPINREFRFFAQAEFIPFPSFKEDDDIYGTTKSASAMELELGLKYQYTSRMTLDGSVEALSRRAKFKGDYKELSYKDNRLKLGVSFNF